MKKAKRDYLIFTLIFQFFICSVFFGALYALKQVNSDLITDLKNGVFNNLDKNFTFIDDKKDEKPKDRLETPEEKETTESVNTSPVSTGNEVKKAEFLTASITENESQADTPDNVCASFYTLNEKVISPVKNGVVTSEFGERIHPIYNEERYHAGIDIGAPDGTPIYASFSGVCEVATYDEWNGYYIKLKHEGDIMTVYCHCSKLNIKKGDKVKAGDVIAYVGSTGSSTGPHLHYEIRVNNVSLNPEFALSASTDAV